MSEQHKFVPVGYLHRLHTECGSQVRFSDSTASPFGKCGVDYDPSYTVSCAQVYEHVAPMATEEHEEIQQRIRLGARQSGKSWLRQTTGLPCPNHGNSHCMACMWPRGKVTISGLRDEAATFDVTPEFEQSTGYTAVDMTTAAAEGFRDGRDSVVVELPAKCNPLGVLDLCSENYNEAIDDCREAIEAAGGKVKE